MCHNIKNNSHEFVFFWRAGSKLHLILYAYIQENQDFAY